MHLVTSDVIAAILSYFFFDDVVFEFELDVAPHVDVFHRSGNHDCGCCVVQPRTARERSVKELISCLVLNRHHESRSCVTRTECSLSIRGTSFSPVC